MKWKKEARKNEENSQAFIFIDDLKARTIL